MAPTKKGGCKWVAKPATQESTAAEDRSSQLAIAADGHSETPGAAKSAAAQAPQTPAKEQKPQASKRSTEATPVKEQKPQVRQHPAGATPVKLRKPQASQHPAEVTPAKEQKPPERQRPAEATPQDQRRKAAAERLALYVAGVLSGAHGAEKVTQHVNDIVLCLGEQALEGAGCTGKSTPYWTVRHSRDVRVSLALACEAVVAAIGCCSRVLPSGILALSTLCRRLPQHGVDPANLLAALRPYLCPKCGTEPPSAPQCRKCHGTGQGRCTHCLGSGYWTAPCQQCGGTGWSLAWMCACPGCWGHGALTGECDLCHLAEPSCSACDMAPACGLPRPFCATCQQQPQQPQQQPQQQQLQQQPPDQRQLQPKQHKQQGEQGALTGRRPCRREDGPPSAGVTIARCTPSQLADLKTLWEERKAEGRLLEAWRVDNPQLTWHFHARRAELKQTLGRSADELQGFHGTHPNNVISICQNGFDSGKRSGQVYGAGEYFAKCPEVSVGYCKGGEYMLVCRLTLGVPSSTEANLDGDHIWVPSRSYYVISSPAQALPIYILRFASQRCLGLTAPSCAELEKVLKSGSWTTKEEEAVVAVPPNRPCVMSRPTATVLWIGLLHAHHPDEQLDGDVRKFLQEHAPGHAAGLKVQIVKGKFKKAHAILAVPIPRDLVHQLNGLPFVEGGTERTVCVEDAHGSPEQKCPKWIAGYCRGQNLRFTHPCWCYHPRRSTERARYCLQDVSLASAKGNEIAEKFMKSAPFHDGAPHVVRIKAIINDTLARCHEEYRQYLSTKHGEEPTVRELYHGTNNRILEVLYQHGLQPPADADASDACPVSGRKGLSTTLCNNDCQYCTQRHEWSKCHMFGLGIYLADLSQKSHRYCSQPEMLFRRRRFRMVVCSVLGRAFKIEGHLRCAKAMHDVVNSRALQEEEMAEMIEPCCGAAPEEGKAESAEKSDMLFVQGLGSRSRSGFSVVNSEYVAYHPHQCLPKYEITYEL